MSKLIGLALFVSVFMAGGSAMAQSSIAPGQTISGRLERGDRLTTGFAAGSFYDCYRVAARPGQTVKVTATSGDAVILALGASSESCPHRLSNAEVSAIAPREVVQTIGPAGDYWVVVMGQDEGAAASYSLRMTVVGRP